MELDHSRYSSQNKCLNSEVLPEINVSMEKYFKKKKVQNVPSCFDLTHL